MQHLRSLREFIAELEKIGDVQSIDKEVDWNLELGAIARRSYELRAPAPLFTNITGDKDGFRVLAAPGGLSAVHGRCEGRGHRDCAGRRPEP
jgi:4-hydroxy-3-polyprenylbenzoate decarboxylase